MKFIQCSTGALLAALVLTPALQARPIVFARSTTAMAEYREGALAEAQVFYAPTYYLSYGLGHFELENEDMSARHYVTYARLNLLAKRWNLPAAQGNVFLWGGAGQAQIGDMYLQPAVPGEPSEHDHGESPTPEPVRVPAQQDFAWNAGGQIDFETRRIYTSFKTDFHYSSIFWHRADTLQFGFAPYQHDVDTLATWFVVSGRRYSGNMHEGTEVALLLRFFKKKTWIEAGATTDGKLQAMAMFNF